jgi:hypothetical protein
MVYANEADLLNVAFFGVSGYLNPLKLWYIIVGGTIYLGEMKVGYPTCLPISVTKGEWRFRACVGGGRRGGHRVGHIFATLCPIF